MIRLSNTPLEPNIVLYTKIGTPTATKIQNTGAENIENWELVTNYGVRIRPVGDEFWIDDTNYLIMDSIKNNKNKIISNNITLEKSRQIIKIDDNEKTKYNGTLTYRIDSIFIIGTTSKVESKITRKLYDGEPTEMIELFSKSSSGNIKIKEIITGEIMDIDLISLDTEAFIIKNKYYILI